MLGFDDDVQDNGEGVEDEALRDERESQEILEAGEDIDEEYRIMQEDEEEYN